MTGSEVLVAAAIAVADECQQPGITTGESPHLLATVTAKQRHCHCVGGTSDHLPQSAGVFPTLQFGDTINLHCPTVPP